MNHLKDDLDIFKQQHKGPVLVIGASGFIGSSYFEFFRKHDIQVYGTTTRQRNWRTLTLGEEFFELDLTNQDQVKELILKIRPKLIVNCASYGNFHWHEDPSRNFEVNIKGLLNLLEVCRSLTEATLVHMGSSSEYGENVSNANENFEPLPNSLYGVMKKTSSELIEYYHRVHKVQAIHLRLFSIYGPFESPDRFIPKLVASKQTGKLPPIAKNATSRDFVYIDDLIQTSLKLVSLAPEKRGGEVVNICSSRSYTLEEAAKTVKNLWDISEDLVFSEQMNRKWDVKDWQGDHSKLMELIGEYQFKSLEQALPIMAERVEEIQSKRVQVERKDKVISLIIASYNDEKNLVELYSQVQAAFEETSYDFELIVVDDHSTDKTKELIQKFSADDSRILGIHHTRSFGSQAAFLSGLHQAKGNAMVFMDGDLQDPPHCIPKMIEKWEQGVKVVGAKRVSRSEAGWMTGMRKLFYRLLSLISLSPVHIDVGDFALIDRKVGEKITKYAYGVYFLRTLRAYFGFSYDEIFYHRPERFHGKSSNNLFKNLWWALFGFFSITNKLSFFSSVFLLLVGVLLIFGLGGGVLFKLAMMFALFVLVNQVYLFMFNFNKFPPYVVKEYIFHGKVHPQD